MLTNLAIVLTVLGLLFGTFKFARPMWTSPWADEGAPPAWWGYSPGAWRAVTAARPYQMFLGPPVAATALMLALFDANEVRLAGGLGSLLFGTLLQGTIAAVLLGPLIALTGRPRFLVPRRLHSSGWAGELIAGTLKKDVLGPSRDEHEPAPPTESR